MFAKIAPFRLLLLWALLLLPLFTLSAASEFAFNGFRGPNRLLLDGQAAITTDGLLRLTNATKMMKSHAFYQTPVRFKPSNTSNALSFSTTFVFGIQFTQFSGHGIAFVVTNSTDFSSATGSQYLGIASNNGTAINRFFGVELDTIQNPELGDINDNHVGIDVNGLRSIASYPAGYYTDCCDAFQNLSLSSGDPMQVWVDYDGAEMLVEVTIAPFRTPKPRTPLLSTAVGNLSAIFSETMYVGFSASTDPFQTSHYILGWSFNMSGAAQLDLSSLPPLPVSRHKRRLLAIWLPIVIVAVVVAVAGGVVIVVMRKIKFSELREDWEQDYGPMRLSYKTLFDATNGFRPRDLLGSGGFGSVYRGVLPTSNTEVAVKRISHESRQGIKEFVAEIVSIGRVRHRNLVQLLGYCRRRRELMLVYEFMPNGSLDKLLFDDPPRALGWAQRFQIIKGVASGLQYLHEGWEQVIIHRDIKASNVLLDGDMNGRLGDFGLARLYDHGSDPQTTHIVGTMGYLAPELTRTSRASKATDVYAFGAFMMEVATGRRPIEPRSPEEEVVLVDWVLEAMKRGALLDVADPRMGGEYVAEEVEMVLKLGLLCSHPLPTARPQMRHVVRIISGEGTLPELPASYMDAAALDLLQLEALGDCVVSYPYSFSSGSVLSSGGR